MPDTERLLTVRDLQEKLGVGKDAAYFLVASGSIPSIRVGGGRLIRIRPATFDRWLESQERGAS